MWPDMVISSRWLITLKLCDLDPRSCFCGIAAIARCTVDQNMEVITALPGKDWKNHVQWVSASTSWIEGPKIRTSLAQPITYDTLW